MPLLDSDKEEEDGVKRLLAGTAECPEQIECAGDTDGREAGEWR